MIAIIAKYTFSISAERHVVDFQRCGTAVAEAVIVHTTGSLETERHNTAHIKSFVANLASIGAVKAPHIQTDH